MFVSYPLPMADEVLLTFSLYKIKIPNHEKDKKEVLSSICIHQTMNLKDKNKVERSQNNNPN